MTQAKINPVGITVWIQQTDVGCRSDIRSNHFGHLGHLAISFLTSLKQQLFRNIAYVCIHGPNGPNSQSGPKWPKVAQMAQSGPKWPKVAQSSPGGPGGPKWPKWPKVAQSGPKWPKVAQVAQVAQSSPGGPKWPRVAQSGPWWPRMAEMAQSGPNCQRQIYLPENSETNFFLGRPVVEVGWVWCLSTDGRTDGNVKIKLEFCSQNSQ